MPSTLLKPTLLLLLKLISLYAGILSTLLKTELMPTPPLLKLLMLKLPTKKNLETPLKLTEIKLRKNLKLKPLDGMLTLLLMKTLWLN